MHFGNNNNNNKIESEFHIIVYCVIIRLDGSCFETHQSFFGERAYLKRGMVSLSVSALYQLKHGRSSDFELYGSIKDNLTIIQLLMVFIIVTFSLCLHNYFFFTFFHQYSAV